jgi:hypothetical protein
VIGKIIITILISNFFLWVVLFKRYQHQATYSLSYIYITFLLKELFLGSDNLLICSKMKYLYISLHSCKSVSSFRAYVIHKSLYKRI